MSDLTREQIVDLKNICPNLQLGSSCWASCGWRENGICELNIRQVLNTAIKLLSEDYNKDNKNNGCNYCNTNRIKSMIGYEHIRFCPLCGKPIVNTRKEFNL